jgi:hypothetical protein
VAPEKIVRIFAAVLGAQEYNKSYYVSCKKKFVFKLKIGGKVYAISSDDLLMVVSFKSKFLCVSG